MARWLRGLSVGVACVGLSACVQDAKVEDELPPSRGATQPGSDAGGTLSADEACTDLTAALTKARGKLHCKKPADADLVCPAFVAVAGALPCDAYTQASVKVCVSRIGGYSDCSDFDTKPCVVTAVRASCHTPGLPEAGPDGSPTEGGVTPDATSDAPPSPEAGPDTGVLPAEAGVLDGAHPDAGPPAPTDAGHG